MTTDLTAQILSSERGSEAWLRERDILNGLPLAWDEPLEEIGITGWALYSLQLALEALTAASYPATLLDCHYSLRDCFEWAQVKANTEKDSLIQ
jgi:hypothetical protein